MNPAEHLRSWFTPERRKLISSRALDELTGRYPGTFSRFLAGEASYVLTRGRGLTDYYAILALLGYVPPRTSVDTSNGPMCAPVASLCVLRPFRFVPPETSF